MSTGHFHCIPTAHSLPFATYTFRHPAREQSYSFSVQMSSYSMQSCHLHEYVGTTVASEQLTFARI